MLVINELLWTMFLIGFGACFGWSLKEHLVEKASANLCDRIENALDSDIVTDTDYRPLPQHKRRFTDV